MPAAQWMNRTWPKGNGCVASTLLIPGSGVPMKQPVTHSTTMASALTQCQMRTGA